MADPLPGDETLNSLIEFAKSADLEELAWEDGEKRVSFRRRIADPPPPVSPAAPAASAAPAAESSPLRFITSPMVGTFWRSASNDRPPLVVEGGKVSGGQKMAVVMAMSIPKDVVSSVAGRIVKILVENGKPVEYGQKLFEIEIEVEANG
jgi:acetyl-CoA carboxylase biotin carboxyl carrier protein